MNVHPSADYHNSQAVVFLQWGCIFKALLQLWLKYFHLKLNDNENKTCLCAVFLTWLVMVQNTCYICVRYIKVSFIQNNQCRQLLLTIMFERCFYFQMIWPSFSVRVNLSKKRWNPRTTKCCPLALVNSIYKAIYTNTSDPDDVRFLKSDVANPLDWQTNEK